MDREQQIEIVSYKYSFVYMDDVKHIRYVMKCIIDNQELQCNLQMIYDGNVMSKYEFLEKAKDGIIRERYR